MERGSLYLCPTPLGNLDDITLRVLKTLREVQVIAAEDTRRTRKLLSHFDIHTPLISYHEHSRAKRTEEIIDRLLRGENVALVSDAGTPVLSDPGEELIREALRQKITVYSLPGPVAAVTALVASGLPAVPFVFYGFLPPKGKQKKEVLAKMLAEDKTVIFYEAPHRLRKTLAALKEADSERRVVVARELTKLHEQYHHGSLEEIWRYFEEHEPRGEITVLLSPRLQKNERSREELLGMAVKLLEEGFSVREAARKIAQLTGGSRNEIYNLLIKKE
jgi:16S rRNA (cytidine1402-2'-O)-methyltransferase